ncbi:hypothetical protein WT60_04110 [Burkholderia sp. MSMB617WGS]|nr:hypothetical protein WT60_04110 [Burkholderia sp. MSMB617WGS]
MAWRDAHDHIGEMHFDRTVEQGSFGWRGRWRTVVCLVQWRYRRRVDDRNRGHRGRRVRYAE